MMIYTKPVLEILSCDPRACLATGAMGKPQRYKRVPIVKHENQLLPFSSLFFPPLLPSSLTLPPLLRGVADAFCFDQVSKLARSILELILGGSWFDDDI